MKENIHNRLKEIETEDFIFLIFVNLHMRANLFTHNLL